MKLLDIIILLYSSVQKKFPFQFHLIAYCSVSILWGMLIALLLMIHGYAFCKLLLKWLGVLQAILKWSGWLANSCRAFGL